MTVATRPDSGPDAKPKAPASESRPDQAGTQRPAQQDQDPATGTEGALGADGSKEVRHMSMRGLRGVSTLRP